MRYSGDHSDLFHTLTSLSALWSLPASSPHGIRMGLQGVPSVPSDFGPASSTPLKVPLAFLAY